MEYVSNANKTVYNVLQGPKIMKPANLTRIKKVMEEIGIVIQSKPIQYAKSAMKALN